MLQNISPHIIIESICLVIALLCLRKEPSFFWRAFVYFLLITVLVEITGFYYLRRTLHVDNAWLYNTYLLFESAFMSLMFNDLLTKYTKPRVPILLGFLSFCACFVAETWYHSFWVYNFVTNALQSIFIVVCILYYYYLLLKDGSYIGLKKHAAFWWVAGTLFFHFGSTICNIGFTTLSVFVTSQYTLRYFVFIVLNLILYSFWSYSFICRYRLSKK